MQGSSFLRSGWALGKGVIRRWQGWLGIVLLGVDFVNRFVGPDVAWVRWVALPVTAACFLAAIVATYHEAYVIALTGKRRDTALSEIDRVLQAVETLQNAIHYPNPGVPINLSDELAKAGKTVMAAADEIDALGMGRVATMVRESVVPQWPERYRPVTSEGLDTLLRSARRRLEEARGDVWRLSADGQ